jgi:hypothetical protein
MPVHIEPGQHDLPICRQVEVMIRLGIVSGSFGNKRLCSGFSRALLIAAVCCSRLSLVA